MHVVPIFFIKSPYSLSGHILERQRRGYVHEKMISISTSFQFLRLQPSVAQSILEKEEEGSIFAIIIKQIQSLDTLDTSIHFYPVLASMAWSSFMGYGIFLL